MEIEHHDFSKDDAEELNKSHGDFGSIGSEQIYSSSEYSPKDERIARQESEVGSESGVEPDYSEWVFDENIPDDGAFCDLTNEQALATLRYFSSTANRTNMMAKTHGFDLDLLSQLLLDKEKDLDMAAKIGQSLLQRNRNLLLKIEQMEDYLSESKDSEMQLKHDLQHKNELARIYFEEDERRSISSDGSRECDDSEIIMLTKRCRTLEKENHDLFSEALNLRQETNEIEEKEEGLVLDCIEQLSTAKQQITALTDEIAQKFEDNVQQQEEITQLIDMVVELQKKQKQLSIDNDDLQMQLLEAHSDKNNLKEQLSAMQLKFQETYEILQENQEEMKTLRSRVDLTSVNPSEWLGDSGNAFSLQDSLANEIEESVRRDLINTHERRKNDKKVMNNVRNMNIKVSGSTASLSSSMTSGRTSPSSNWSLASDERSDTLSTSGTDFEGNKPKKSAKKLQIVKRMEGSDTLNKWHHLASQNVRGGLNVSEGTDKQKELEQEVSFDDDHATIIPDDKTALSHLHDNLSPIASTSSENEDRTLSTSQRPKIRKPIKPSNASTPNSKKGTFMNGLNTPAETKRTIITRSSSALQSLRHGRRMLRNKENNGKSKVEVIDMIASAMNKANVEAQTGQRILSSLSSSKTNRKDSAQEKRERKENLSKSPEFQDMPHVSKVLEKVALNSDSLTTTSLSDDLESEVDDAPSVMLDLNSVGGPLGLLNRVEDPNEPSKDIMNRLLRYSSIDTNAPPPSTEHKSLVNQLKDSDTKQDIRRNKSSGSLVEMMMSNKLHVGGIRPMGLLNSSESSSTGLLGVLGSNNNMSGRTAMTTGTIPKESSKSVETGLDEVKKAEVDTNTATGGGSFGFLTSFLGKLS